VTVHVNLWPAFALKMGRGTGTSKLLLPFALVALVPHLLRMAALVRRERIDLVHTNGLKSHVVGSATRILAGRPLVWHVRDVLRPGVTRRMLNRLAGATVTTLIANSRATAETFPRLPSSRIRIVYNGIDADLYSPGPQGDLRSRLGLSPRDFVVGAMGALAPLKGHIHLIRAAPAILSRCPEARFLIAGEEMYLTIGHRGYRAILEEEVRRLGLAERVVFAGWRDSPVEVLRSLDVLVHSSIYPESFGRVLVEAMACGVPVVATALGGPVEIIASPEQGILIPPEHPEAIADAVLRLHSDPELRRNMARAGRERVVSAFSVGRYVRQVEEVYRAIGDTGTSGHASDAR
jgi:glycosyltransferase involved in cell wall biosynthesis